MLSEVTFQPALAALGKFGSIRSGESSNASKSNGSSSNNISSKFHIPEDDAPVNSA
jgi:hypothetical protein